MIGHISLLIIAVCLSAVVAKDRKPVAADTSQMSIDTTPPVVKILPQEIYHGSLFHVTFSSNKPGIIWYSVVSPSSQNATMKLEQYKSPITITDAGMTRIYFQGEDLLGNRSHPDSMTYVIDTRQPVLSIFPESGRYRAKIMVHLSADKPCRFFYMPSQIDTAMKPLADSFAVADSLSGYIVAVDKAGNRTQSKKCLWTVDATTVSVNIAPPEGMYSRRQDISLSAVPDADIFYTFDPSAVPRQFTKYEKPVPLPYGNTIVRFYARTALGAESDIRRSAYVIDTTPPKLSLVRKAGEESDTLLVVSKKMSVIRYTLDGTFPNEKSSVLTNPIIVPRTGRCILKAVATDLAGNRSELLDWSFKYDESLPQLSLSHQSGSFNRPFTVTVRVSKPATVFYTLDGSEATQRSLLYRDGISVSKEGETSLRLIAVDDIGNASEEVREDYVVDTKPPVVHVKTEEDVQHNTFLITLTADEPADIYYEIDGRAPSRSSTVYEGRIQLKMGQMLRYFAVDKAGNESLPQIMDALKKPMVAIAPEGGVYNHQVRVSISSTEETTIYFRAEPDTEFSVFHDSLVLAKEGLHVIDYYSQNASGLTSPMRRSEYLIDMSPPVIDVIVKKGNGDSVSVFFESSKNASIYYTLDGSNPAYSNTVRMTGNKYLSAHDRISVQRKADVRLAYYAEDAAGNQSPIRVLDIFKPRAVPDIPAGREHVYDRVLSVTLNTFDSKSVIYYARHGHIPTTDSAMFSQPFTLMASDTICAFVGDAAGYRGQVDTFVYLIDLPPSPAFSWVPHDVTQGDAITFDASKTIDLETPISKLLFRWDFNGDGTFETQWSNNPVATYTYAGHGLFPVTLTVQDAMKHSVALKKDILVHERCPMGMLSYALEAGHTYCIDKYEWPNVAGQKPYAFVSWVQANMSCMDAGKRLCTAEEWNNACKGVSRAAYPYGEMYRKGKCVTEARETSPSGKADGCGDPSGVRDMVGNVWEWVVDKRGDYPKMMGGSFRFGKEADCNLSSEGGIGLKSAEVGFRCCK